MIIFTELPQHRVKLAEVVELNASWLTFAKVVFAAALVSLKVRLISPFRVSLHKLKYSFGLLCGMARFKRSFRTKKLSRIMLDSLAWKINYVHLLLLCLSLLLWLVHLASGIRRQIKMPMKFNEDEMHLR